MNNTKITVFTEEKIGVIKKLNGGNLAPAITSEKSGGNIRSEFQALNLPLTRLHDAPLDNPGARLVDVPMIFANFHADVNDPNNYYFRQTDDYIKNCIELGTGIIYRLGVSIEHGFNKYFTSPPTDYDRWIDICDHIIRHYTEGWADGFNFDIKYWEIWNEPEVCDGDGLHLMWGGTLDEYNEFYVKTATELKKRFPHLKFGGPAHTNAKEERTKKFLAACAKAKAPLDFYSWHCYSKDVEHMTNQVFAVKEWLVAGGYPNAELHLNEWHYFPADWKRLRSDKDYMKKIYDDDLKGLDSAAFLSSVMISWQDTPLDMSCYYTVTSMVWGVFTVYCELTKSYFGLKAFGEVVKYPQRIKTAVDGESFYALAGTNENEELTLLVSGFNVGKNNSLQIEFDGIKSIASDKWQVMMLDDEHNLEEFAAANIAENVIEMPIKSNSAVIIVKLYR